MIKNDIEIENVMEYEYEKRTHDDIIDTLLSSLLFLMGGI